MHHTEGCPNSWEYNIFTIGSVHTDTDYNTWKHQNFMRDIALISRENDKPIKTSQPTIAQKTDNCIEELTKLKDLLDTGVITQEEFDAKKKQILGV